MQLINFILHIDQYIPLLMEQYGIFIYLILFLIIFCETGLVVLPFLPGDSIIFACGALAISAKMDIGILLAVFITAAIIGDGVNYLIGHYLGDKFLERDHRLIKINHIKKAQTFYERYGGKAVFLARFVPIVRTFAPFIAGIGKMDYKKFGFYNIIGGCVWVILFLMLGYFFGNLPVFKDHFSFVVIGIILFSLLPVVFEIYKARSNRLSNV